MAWADDCDTLDRDCRDAFAESIVYTAQGGAAVSLSATFERTGAVVDLQTGVSVNSTAPRLWLRLADLPAAPRQGDTFARDNGEEFEVVNVTPDGPGAAWLSAFEV